MKSRFQFRPAKFARPPDRVYGVHLDGKHLGYVLRVRPEKWQAYRRGVEVPGTWVTREGAAHALLDAS